MNGFYSLLAAVINGLVALHRWVWGWQEDAGYTPPERVFHSALTAHTVALPQFASTAVELKAPVSLRKPVRLVRPFVGMAVDGAMRWVATARIPSAFELNIDELGLPREPMARKTDDGVGIFEQAWDSFLRRNRDLAWA